MGTFSSMTVAQFVIAGLDVFGMKRARRKRAAIFIFTLPLLIFSTATQAGIIFSEDFEGGNLDAWTGKSGGTHDGFIVGDPLQSDNALSWTSVEYGGETFSIEIFPEGNYLLEYDYLGTCSSGNCGGFVGYSMGLPGEHIWLTGTSTTSGAAELNLDIGSWVHVAVNFSAADSFHLMLEDYRGGIGGAGDAFFDNFALYDVPEPGTLLLFGIGVLGFGVTRRRKRLV